MNQQSYTGPDPRALKLLFHMHWNSKGWRGRSLKLSPEDTKFAKDAGVLFDPIVVSHDGLCKSTIAAVKVTDRRAVADAFVVSLSTRQLELRSAIGSYALFQHLEDHERQPGTIACSICGEYAGNSTKEDLNVMNFERFKWGGVRHQQPTYATLDLQQFQLIPRLYPTPSQVETFKRLLTAIEAVPAKTTPSVLQKYLGDVIDSNKPERGVLINMLGYCSILTHPEYPTYLKTFVTWEYAETNSKWMSETRYPACWWRGKDGINQEALHYWFGHLL